MARRHLNMSNAPMALHVMSTTLYMPFLPSPILPAHLSTRPNPNQYYFYYLGVTPDQMRTYP